MSVDRMDAEIFWWKMRVRLPLFLAAIGSAFVAGSIAKAAGIPFWQDWVLGDVVDIAVITGFSVWWFGVYLENVIVTTAISVYKLTESKSANNPRSNNNG